LVDKEEEKTVCKRGVQTMWMWVTNNKDGARWNEPKMCLFLFFVVMAPRDGKI
jgi:hypothetical protein